jgi:hypothetical protein
MSNDAANAQGDLSFDGAAGQPASVPAVPDDAFDTDPWGSDFADAAADPWLANLFSDEIENVNASDWDVDTALIWGDDGEHHAVVEDGGAVDFPL